MIKLNVAYNWDSQLLAKLKPFYSQIRSFYGRLKSNNLPGSRAATSLRDIMSEDALLQIKRIKENNFKFTYILNASPVIDEFGQAKEKIIKEIEFIGEIADIVVVSNPYILELCLKYAPHLELNSSILSHIDNPLKAKRWVSLGVKKILPDWNVMRNFRILEKMIKAIEPYGARLEILVNDPCLLQCPYVHCHDQAMAKGSTKKMYEHYWTYRCCNDYMKNPGEIMRAVFVRPEDLHYYEDIGITDFKIADRNRSTDFIVESVAAYYNRKYDGNLCDILSIFAATYSHSAKDEDLKIITNEEDYFSTIEKRDRYWKNFLRREMGIYIDNNKLDGFLSHFIENKPECIHFKGCVDCQYCENWGRKAVSYSDQTGTLEKIRTILDKIHNKA